jgi:two-component system, NarL family, sensor kinase
MLINSEEVYYSVIVGSIFAVLLVGIVVITVFLYHIRRKKYLLEVKEFEKVLLKARTEIQEQTLKNISQEIHDNIAQTLSLVKLNLSTMNLQRPEKSVEKIQFTQELVRKTINDLRNLSKSLHMDTVLSNGIENALNFELNRIHQSGGFETEFNVVGDPVPIKPQIELILFRIAQEALQNSIKHSGAKSLKILFEYGADFVKLKIEDDGRGFQLSEIPSTVHSGAGMMNMRSRALSINGDISIDSKLSLGTRVCITVPLY